jgi:4,5-dihydroxyphthalate decarboxylase
MFRETGVFPIMHLITVRRTVFEQYPWVAMNLLKAFEEAKRRSFERLRDFTLARAPLPWIAAFADEIAASYGPDPYPYGVEASRPTIEAFCRYAHAQGVTPHLMKPEDLFPPEVRATAKV